MTQLYKMRASVYGYIMTFSRRSGVLLHLTSLPKSSGIGTLGKSAYEFADWLHEAHQSLWQILPLGPTGYGDSPYASFSTFAGNPLLIDLELLVKNGWACAEDIVPPEFIKTFGVVDYGAVVYWKLPLLEKCAAHFLLHCTQEDRTTYEAFKNDNAAWLNKYAAFTSIKNHFDKKAQAENVRGSASMWNAFWPRDLALCEPAAVSKWESGHVHEIEVVKVIQFFFAMQWRALKAYCNERGISIIGDIPIFVALDSSDVWAHQHLFQLDANGIPVAVAGVPPDYFSETGQLWGNPLYDWRAMKNENYSWWISRIARMRALVDFVRIDHFRGFESYWAVPYGEATAVHGTWEKGPGIDLFTAIKKSLGDLPVIAEDLGVITDEVRALRNECGFPGMKVLQFAFDPNEAGASGMTNAFLPHEYRDANCICYTGTHDNDTLQGWLLREGDATVQLVASYVFGKQVAADHARALVQNGTLCEKIVQLAFASTAQFAVVPLQDVLHLDNSARMNEPSTTGKNWQWRMEAGMLGVEAAEWLAYMSRLYGRNAIT